MSNELDHEEIKTTPNVLEDSEVKIEPTDSATPIKEQIDSSFCINLISDEEESELESDIPVSTFCINLVSDEEELESESDIPMPIPMLEQGVAILIPVSDPNVPMAIPISPLPYDLNQLNSMLNEQNQASCSSVLIDARLSESEIIDVSSRSGSEHDTSIEPNHKKNLKRKRNLIPSYIEVENTRKTMKPGPKSKTRNMLTVHEMITQAKLLRSGVTLDSSDASDEEMILDTDDSERDDECAEEEESDEDESAEDESAEDESAEDESAEHESAEHESAEHESAEDEHN